MNLLALPPTPLREADVNMLSRSVRVRVAGLVIVSMSGILAGGLRAQQIGRTPVEVQVPQPPTAAVALGRVHLVYELHVTNFGEGTIALEQLDVLHDDGTVIESWSGRQLWQRVTVLGRPPGEIGTPHTLQPGARGIAYLWISLPPGKAAPASFVHRLTFSHGRAERDTLVTGTVLLPSTAAPSLAAPVRGGPWVAVRGPANASPHRLSLVTLGGRVRVPQRFAVDWALLGDDGLLSRGDPAVLTNWYGYDAPVYAAAAGTVVLVRDGTPDHPPFSAPPPAVMEPTDAAGNIVVLDIGNGRFASYAHLKSGSLQVAEGHRVLEGQPLARIGNSGNTLGPHLHFQINDAVEPLGGEGLPFSLRTYVLLGRVASFPALLAGTPWTSEPTRPVRAVTNEMPLENMVTRFSGATSGSGGR
ncbi:MAG: M23 family metallopeptidase [Vicinamibacterales bacterium]